MYDGVPPLAGLGVKVMFVPAHTGGSGFAVMLTTGVTLCVTVIVMLFDVAVAGLAHVALELITQFICDPLLRYAEENVAPLPA